MCKLYLSAKKKKKLKPSISNRIIINKIMVKM